MKYHVIITYPSGSTIYPGAYASRKEAEKEVRKHPGASAVVVRGIALEVVTTVEVIEPFGD